MQLPRVHVICCAAACLCVASPPAESDEKSKDFGWRKHTINDRSPFEAAGAADFNGDGRLDVFSGDSWYEAYGLDPTGSHSVIGIW